MQEHKNEMQEFMARTEKIMPVPFHMNNFNVNYYLKSS